jgi:hypothetical protein
MPTRAGDEAVANMVADVQAARARGELTTWKTVRAVVLERMQAIFRLHGEPFPRVFEHIVTAFADLIPAGTDKERAIVVDLERWFRLE